ncbi:hypothetical protein FHS78_000619 [Parvibaculum indicum]|uniref:head decoration protein n=1 Tax=Parvibaculum indicum TaxID=562969 RepID=UPI0014206A12|nr:head decoration protein [Parvibaculum indicum]NIJ40349.1 hypothetical protein [Parvibaculum indicum]
MTEFREGFHAGEHLVSEANGYRSRSVGTITGGKYAAGTMLGKITEGGTVTVSEATFEGTGTGALTLATPAYSAAVHEGDYQAICVDPATDGGLFNVLRPDGTMDGVAKVGVAYDGEVKFTIADDTTDFAAGDTFTIPVAIADNADLNKYTQLDPSATDGSQHLAAVLYDGVDASTADVEGTIHDRDCEVNGLAVTWIDGITDNQKAAAIAEGAALGIIVRN